MIKEKPRQIECDEWFYKGCFIQKFAHPKLIGNYEIFKNNKNQDHIGISSTFIEAKKICEENECYDNYLKF